MRPLILIAISIFASLALAEPQTLQVKGMHCGACAKSIEDTVCKMEGVKTCSAKLVNGKKKLGEITIETTDGNPVDLEKVTSALEAAGDYKLVSKKKK